MYLASQGKVPNAWQKLGAPTHLGRGAALKPSIQEGKRKDLQAGPSKKKISGRSKREWGNEEEKAERMSVFTDLLSKLMIAVG